MSDIESTGAPEEVAVEVEEEGVKDLKTAIKRVLKNALIHDGLARGLHEVAKALDSKRAQACFLAESCSEPAYKKLVEGLCKEHKIPLIEVADRLELGQWAGLCRIDSEGAPRRVVKASCVAVTDFGEQSEALTFLQNHIQSLSQ
ncbi:40S ribosomal protein S12, putative [Eimeria praecox]|uniref:40S ribosomal protein S12 n=1 Tax=Eimeria praecox TaxID=51316 RepID=U6H7N6_9EIME|nr:40S ribosomal protein S12, putative [Eimeria praecox]